MAGSRALGLAWLLLLLLAAALGFYLKAPAAWLSALGIERQPAAASAVVVGQLPALSAGSDPPAGAPPAWQANRAAAVPAGDGQPLVAVVLTGLGYDSAVTDLAIALPAPLSVAFSPYARPFGDALQRARAAGHEVLVDLPMEGEGPQADPGPGALLTLLDAPQNLQRMAAFIGSGEPLVGVAVLGGERFLAAPDLVEPVLARLAEQGLMLVAPAVDDALDGALAAGRPVLLVDRRLATEGSSVDALLAELERTALTTGSAVALLPAEPAVLAEIGPWVGSLAARGFVLAPATQVLERRLAEP